MNESKHPIPLQNSPRPEPSGDWLKIVTEAFEETMYDERQTELRKYHQERIDQKNKLVEEFNQKTREGETSLLEKINSMEEARRKGFKRFLQNDIGLRFDVAESSKATVSFSITTALTETVTECEETLTIVTSRSAPEISSMAVKMGKLVPPVPPPKPAALAGSVRHSVAREEAAMPLPPPTLQRIKCPSQVWPLLSQPLVRIRLCAN